MKLIEKVRETAKVLKTLSRRPRRQPPKRLRARVRATTAATADDYEDEEPQTKLTSAFVVVLILHLVAVGGIYAFNEIKASRKTVDSGRIAETAKQTSTTAPTVTPARQPDRSFDTTTNGSLSTAAPAVASVPPATSKPRVYTVKSGDTLHGIAKANGLSVNDVKSVNGLTGDGIRPGQTLNLVAAKSTPPTGTEALPDRTELTEPKLALKSYTVKGGDRLVFIAKRFSVSQEDLMALNKIKDPSKLQIGQTLKIPAKK
jgi:LysM repeat protein